MNEIIEQKAGSTKLDFSGAEYNAVAVAAQLEAINLLASNFDTSPECLADHSKWKLSYARKVVSCTCDEEGGYVAAILRYEVTAKFGRKKAMTCGADYGIYYSIPEGSKADAAIGFCRNVGAFAAYPYFRSLVAQLTWNAGINLPPLPAIASTAHIPKKASEVKDEG
jgi:preprotein translocase subunit SecB